MFDKIRERIRQIILDNSKSTFETFIATDSNIFSISQDNIIDVTNITVNGISIGNAYSLDGNNVTLESGTFSTNDVVIIYFDYTKWSDSELDSYILSTLTYLDSYTYPISFIAESGNLNIYPIPNRKEQSLISLIASILIQPNFSQYQTSSVNVRYPRTMTKEERIEKLISKFKFSKEGISGIIDMLGSET
jgi:hypothetical protein